jgi:CubicO group peptidase (beta-lactamase class C family)
MKARSAAAIWALVVWAQAATAAPDSAAIDKVFAGIGSSAPGCAVGVEAKGQAPVLRAYGLTDLEHGVPNTTDSVFEAGSVSKQFTAAATLMLVEEKRLSLDDDVRKYVPELPDYGRPITIAELLGHTSGLRDWSSIVDIGGWPRGDRVYTLDDVLRITSRQRALNYAPGAAYSYTNTGYNLLAIIVQRVSGHSLADFTRERLFIPLGMTHTQWRDDFRRVVPNRAIAYERGAAGAYAQSMPFENTYGHGGLLTTAGDLLTWNRALSEGRLGEFVTTELQRRTVLTDNRAIDYARGLFIKRYHGLREVFHDGATAGYRAWLGRFPDQGLSIALLCNAADANTGELAHAVADLYLPPAPPEAAAEPAPLDLAGWYVNERYGRPLHLVVRDGRVVTEGGAELKRKPSGGFSLSGVDLARLPDGRLSVDVQGDPVVYVPTRPWTPTAEDLTRAAGRYRNDEAEAVYVVTPEAGGLRVTMQARPSQSELFGPAYADAFVSSERVLRLIRAPDGSVKALRIQDSRVWDLVLDRVP